MLRTGSENEGSASAGVTQLVECNLAKVDVAGSNPVSRSIPRVNFSRALAYLISETVPC